MRNSPAFKHNIWMHLYQDRYDELFSYSMKLVGDNRELAEEMVRSLSIASYADEKKLDEELSKLPPTYEDVLRLYFLKTKSADEITKELSLTIYQVNRRIRKGICIIRRKINPSYYKDMIERFYRDRPDVR